MSPCKSCDKNIPDIDNGYCDILCMHSYIESLEAKLAQDNNMSKRIISDQKAYEIIARNKELETTINNIKGNK